MADELYTSTSIYKRFCDNMQIVYNMAHCYPTEEMLEIMLTENDPYESRYKQKKLIRDYNLAIKQIKEQVIKEFNELEKKLENTRKNNEYQLLDNIKHFREVITNRNYELSI